MIVERNERLPAIWMITAAFCFASMGALTHAAGSHCDWLLIALFRIVITFVVAVGLAWVGGARLVLFTPKTLWIRSIAGTISLFCSFYALTHLPVADVLTLTNTYPLWIVLMSIRRLNPRELGIDLVCVLSGVVGVVLIQRPYLSGGGNLAVLIALVSSIAAAIAMLGLHRLRTVDAGGGRRPLFRSGKPGCGLLGGSPPWHGDHRDPRRLGPWAAPGCGPHGNAGAGVLDQGVRLGPTHEDLGAQLDSGGLRHDL